MKTKLFTLFVALVCVTQAFAYDFVNNGIYYNFLGGDSVAVTSGNRQEIYDDDGNLTILGTYSGELYIPAQVAHKSTIYRVTNISYEAFRGCPDLTSISIPTSITSASGIGYQCPKLTSIIWNARHIRTDGYNIFSWDTECPITSFVFGDDVEHIPSNLCRNMKYLTDVIIPENVKTIGYGVFNDCSHLTTITWNAINCRKGTEASNDILWDGNADSESPLTTVIIGKNVQQLPHSLFDNCKRLTQTIYMGDIASWCKIRFGSYHEQSGYWEYWGANPIENSQNLYINGQSITKLVISEGVTSISDYAFVGLTPLTQVSFPSTLTQIGSYTFYECENLTNFVLPNNLTIIGKGAFQSCSGLTEVTIPNSVRTIGEYAFYHCSNLTSVTIGTGLETLEVCAFTNCSKLTKFICNSTKAIEAEEDEDYKNDAYIGQYALSGAFVLTNKQLDTIVAPAQLFDLSEPAWSNLTKSARYIQVNSGELTPDAFGVINRSFDKLKTLDISATTNTEIANNAFKGCYKLETLLLPAQLERIGYMAVADCKNLQGVDIPATVTAIDDSAFENCRGLETLTFGRKQPASVSASRETRMKSVSTASTSALTRIGNWAFYNCHELQHLEIPEGVSEIGAAAFYGCTYLEDLTLPASVQSIGDNCFALCSKLNEITCLATTPPAIEAKTFYDVKRNIPLYVPASSITTYENDTYWGAFINQQAAPETETSISSPTSMANSTTRKVLENGTLYIIHDGVYYTLDGQKVK